MPRKADFQRYVRKNPCSATLTREAVIQNLTAESIYEVPMLMEEQGLDTVVLKKLDMEDKPMISSCYHFLVLSMIESFYVFFLSFVQF